MKIVNLTQHKATQDQLDQGVFDLSPELRPALLKLLTFVELPTTETISRRATAIVRWIQSNHVDCDAAMIGGAPFLMSHLEFQLQLQKITPLFAFSERVSEETTALDGTVTKINVFKHVGFVGGVA
jgi:hypothetical protein